MEQSLELAWVGITTDVTPIYGADRIQQATVNLGSGGIWKAVVGIDLKVNDKIIAFLHDSILPANSRWSFMEKLKYKVKISKFKGTLSECLVIPMIEGDPDIPGQDVTDYFGITKYSKPIKNQNQKGDAKDNFPSFLPKTDEVNFQRINFDYYLNYLNDFHITEKADGSSCTAYVIDDGLHVCSRNFEVKEFSENGASNIYWRVARKYKLEDMPIGTAIQFEVVGPGVQSNPHGLDELEGRLFGVFKQDPSQHMWQKQSYPYDNIVAPLMPRVKDFYFSPHIFWTRESIETACAIYYGNGNPGEGIVFAADDGSWSFKAINPNYKF